MESFNLWAVVAAAVVSFLLGGLWYSRLLFGDLWMRESGRDQAQGHHPARVFGLSFVFALVAAWVFARHLGPDPLLKDAVLQGLLVGAAYAGTSLGINYQFSGRSLKLLFIDAGYHVAQFGLFGMVLGLWP